MIFSDNTDMRLGQRQKRSLYFLFFDDVATTERSGAGRKINRDCSQRQEKKRRSSGGERHDSTIVMVSAANLQRLTLIGNKSFSGGGRGDERNPFRCGPGLFRGRRLRHRLDGRSYRFRCEREFLFQ